MTLYATVRTLDGPVEWLASPLLVVPAVVAFLGLWFTLVWRLIRVGLYVSETAIRIRGPLRTQTLAWSQVSGIELAPGTLFGVPTAREGIWIITTDGRRVESPVQRRDPDERPGLRNNIAPLLASKDFDRLARELARQATIHNG
jgi:hypothetical protein